MTEAKNNDERFPEVKPTKPGNDTAYIAPIIGKLGYDTRRPWLFGLGTSPNNGVDFHVFLSFDGLNFDDNDIDKIWNGGTADKVKKEVDSATAEIPAAVSAANSAVSAAESAVAASKVNSDAIIAQSEAISEAKSAMDSATAEIQQTAANAASDAAKIRADVARVQNEVDTAKTANSASVEALKSDIGSAKKDLANVHDSLTKAQSAVEQNQKFINDSVAKISNDIAQDRKDITSAQQANANTAKQLDDYSKQAEAQGKTIKSIQDKQDSFTATLADVQGNVSQVSDKVDGLSASLKDTQDNVATVKAQADQLNATLTDHTKSIATLTASAKELSSTLEDADGRLNKVEQTAQTNSSTLSDVQGDLSQVKQTADGMVTTLKDAQGSITQIQQKADGTLAQLKSAQGDIASLQTDVTGIKATLVSHEGDIHTLQADSKSLHDSMQDAQGDISTLKKTSTDVTSELKDHAGRISKAEQTASTLVNEFADQQGHLNRVEQTANGTQQTVANQQGQINTIKTDVNGIHQTITGQGNQIANINVTLSGLNSKYEGVSGDLGKLKDQVTTNSTQITQNQQAIALKADQSTVSNLSGQVSQAQAQLEVQADQISSKVSSTDFKTLDDKVNGMKIGGRNLVAGTTEPYTMGYGIPNTTWQNGYAYESLPTKILTNEILPQNDQFFANLVPGQEYTQTIWFETDADVKKLNAAITWYNNTTGHDEQPAKIIKVGENSYKLFSTYIWPGKTDNNVRLFDIFYLQDAFDLSTGTYIKFGKLKLEEGNVSTDWTPAPEDTIAAIQKNSTAIGQTNKQISLKADQTEVDQIKQTASQNSSRLNVMAGQISSKVTATDVNNIVDKKGYATTSTVQSLITQKAGAINESITSLDSKYNTTVTQVQSLTASIDGLQSTVANKADKSQITQLSNLVQSKVSSSDFNDLKDKTTWKSTDSIDLNNAVSQQKIFVKGGSNLPPGDYWWYVQVESGYDSRIVQYAVSDRDNIHYSRQYDGSKWSAWSQGATESEITQLRDDINLRVKSGDLLSQINLTAHNTLIQSNKIYLDSSSTVFSGKAFIPSAAITSLDAGKITTGYIRVPMSDGNGNSVSIGNDGVNIVSNNQNTPLFSQNRGTAKVNVNAAGISFGATTNDAYEQLGSFSVLLDNTDGSYGDATNLNGIGFVVESQQQYGYPYGGDFFSLARSIKGPPSYYNGFLYEASGSGKHEIGSHFFDPIYIHPYGAANYIKSTWVSWTAWDNNERYPALVQAGPMEGGIAFPKSGRVTLFDASGRYFTPTQWGSAYTDFQHEGPGNAYHDPSQAI